MKKHLLLLVLSLFFVVGGLSLSSYVKANDKEVDNKDSSAETVDLVKREPLTLQVTLQKHYMDGKVLEESYKETIGSMQDFWSYYHGWQVVEQKEGEIIFKKHVQDISPYLKENGYFGLSNGILTIFEGQPESEQVIQSFYQIDTSELESYQAKQLQKGIKIDSKEVYEYVLEAYREMTPSKSVNG